MIIDTKSVQEAIRDIVAEKIDYLKHSLQQDVDENKIFQEVRKEAEKSLNEVMANH